MAVPSALTQYDPSLNSLQQTAQASAGNAINYQSAASLLPQKLKQAILDKLNYNQDIISQQNQAMGNYFSAPSQAREQYQNIFNPFQREALVSQATSNAYAPYATLTDVLNQRMGNVSDIINSGTGAFNAGVTAQQGQSALDQNAYKDALSNAQWMYEQTHARPSSAAPKSPFEQLIQEMLIGQLTGGDTGGGNATQSLIPKEAQPMYSPYKGDGTRSPGGDWIFKSGEWLPIKKASSGISSAGGVSQDDPFGLFK